MKNININAVLRLFKAFVGKNSSKVNETALKFGLIIPDSADIDVINAAIEMYGKDGALLNNTFHKDFSTVAKLSNETLVIQQIMHYFTTYGFESLGVFDENTVYIPAERLEIPEVTDDIKMTLIKAISENDLTERLNALLMSGIALSEQSVNDVLSLYNFIDKDNIDNIKNREIKTALYVAYNIVPKNPDEFLRYLIYKLTKSTLKIKNEDMFYMLKNSDRNLALSMLKNYLTDEDKFNTLSSVFLRNKMLFLALKGNNKELNHIINRLRKLADKNHKALPVSCLDRLTYEDYNKDTIVQSLDNITVFREIRILNALRLYDADPNYIGYKVRNGKMFVSEHSQKKDLEKTINIVTEHLKNRLSNRFKGKVFRIDDNVALGVPISEKQFCAEYPEGTVITIPKTENIVLGIHWFDFDDGKRVDLDLHLRDNHGEQYGWNSCYRSDDRTVLFSGDMTAAPKPDGSSEIYFISKNDNRVYFINLNNFTSNGKIEYTFTVASSDDSTNLKNYAIDPNRIVLQYKDVLESNNSNIGMIVSYRDSFKLILSKAGLGSSRILRSDLADAGLEFMLNSFSTAITFNKLIEMCGGIIVKTPTYSAIQIKPNGDKETVEMPVDYDLSIENLSKDTVISLLSD